MPPRCQALKSLQSQTYARCVCPIEWEEYIAPGHSRVAAVDLATARALSVARSAQLAVIAVAWGKGDFEEIRPAQAGIFTLFVGSIRVR